MEAHAEPSSSGDTRSQPNPARNASGRRRIAAFSLIGVVIGASVLTALAAAAYHGGPLLRNHEPLSRSLRGPLAGLKVGLTRTETRLALVAITVGWAGVVALARAVPARVAIGGIVAAHLIFAIAPPLLSSDIFNYVGYARLEVVHHLNAYEFPLASAPSDPTFQYVGWPINTTAYGPLFTLLTLPLAKLNFIAALWVLKSAMVAASLGCVTLVWASANRLGRDPVPAILFLGLNPVLLIYAVGGGHNDLLMMFLALGGIFFILSEKQAGVLGLAAAAATKLSAGVVLPFAVLGSRRRGRALAWAVAGTLAVALASLRVFGTHVLSLDTVLAHDAALATPNNVPGFLFNDVLGISISRSTENHIGLVVLVPILVFLAVRVYRGANWLAGAGWATATLLATTTWLLPWYLVWWLPLAALQRSTAQRWAAVAMTALVMALQLPLK